MNLYVLSYNNYYNRIVKQEDSLDDYLSFSLYGPLEGVYGFTPGDGVNTTQLLGSNVQMYDGRGDYLIAVTDLGEIDSRWFIIDSKRERTGQWTLTLHRDLIVDFYEPLLESPVFIEKATLEANNDLIFNSEQMTFNQIKMFENKLYDSTKSAWLVGYLNAKLDETDWKTYQIANTTEAYPLTNYDELFNYSNEPIRYVKDIAFWYYWLLGDTTLPNLYLLTFNRDTQSLAQIDSDGTLLVGARATDRRQIPAIVTNFREGVFANPTILANVNTLVEAQTVDLNQYNGKIVFDETSGKYYSVSVSESDETTSELFGSYSGSDTNMQIIKDTMLDILRAQEYVETTEQTEERYPYVNLQATYVTQFLTLTEIDLGGLSVTFNSQAQILEDAPYYMFAMKYTSNNLRLATHLATQLGSKCYDLQVLPYCPVQNYLDNLGNIDLDELTEHKDYELITQEGTTVGELIWCPKSSFTFDIDYRLPVSIDPVEKKIQIECDMYRLCSPNGNGQFQFNAAKNNGVNSFNVDCTYRPINPYIHINPDFGGLYGVDYNDFRGLILQGDFSIPYVSDRWVEFENNNKNYQNSFNRQIENMEVQHKVGRIQDLVGGGVGAASGAASGALVGSIVPGIGTAVGAAVGAAASAIGGIADYGVNEMLRNEAIDYAKDNFGYQLANIQAAPQSIVKTGCITNNNKLVPYIEYYTCTVAEKEALRNKLKYNGMTVMVIDTINKYIYENEKRYIKGQLIRLEGTNEDYHIINSLAGELSKGVYI